VHDHIVLCSTKNSIMVVEYFVRTNYRILLQDSEMQTLEFNPGFIFVGVLTMNHLKWKY
jgi:hypothetical protein